MPATVQFQTQFICQQVAQLVCQLPARDRQKLVKQGKLQTRLLTGFLGELREDSF